MNSIKLQPDQEALLVLMADAASKYPQGAFEVYQHDMGTFMKHKGLPGGSKDVSIPGLRILASYGLLSATQNQHGTGLYFVTPQGYAYAASLQTNP